MNSQKNINLRIMILYGLMVPFCAAASAGFSLLLQPVIDAGLSGNRTAFWGYALGAVFLGLVSAAADYVENDLSRRVRAEFTADLRKSCLADTLESSARDYFTGSASSHLSKLTTDSREISDKYCGSLLKMYRILWSFLFSVIAVILADGKLAVMILFFAMISVNLPKLFQKGADKAEKEYLESCDAYLAEAQNVLSCFLLSKVFGLSEMMRKRHDRKADMVAWKDISRGRKQHLMESISSGITQLSFILTVLFIMVLVTQGVVSIGYVMSVTQLLGGIMVPFEVLPVYLMIYRTGKREYQSYISKPGQPHGEEIAGKKLSEASPNRMELHHVSFAYSEAAPVLRDVSMVLELNKKYAVVGDSGAGKSTLARLLMGFLIPSEGEIRLNGTDISKVREEELYQWLSYQEQRVVMLDDTIENNILLGKRVSGRRLEEVLHKAHVKEMLAGMPLGLQTQVGARGVKLSGGETQRIGLARSLLSDAGFLVFDEITASLDSENALQIEKYILGLSGVGVLMITHRIPREIMEQYDCIFVMSHGTVVEQGSCQELLDRKGKFYRMMYAGASF